MKLRLLLPLAVTIIGCSTQQVMVPIASVHYDGFSEQREVIALLKTHHIRAVPAGEATVMFPILVPEAKFEAAVSLLRTTPFVLSGRVHLYTTVEWKE